MQVLILHVFRHRAKVDPINNSRGRSTYKRGAGASSYRPRPQHVNMVTNESADKAGLSQSFQFGYFPPNQEGVSYAQASGLNIFQGYNPTTVPIPENTNIKPVNSSTQLLPGFIPTISSG